MWLPLLLFLLNTIPTISRMIQHRDSKVDPRFLDDVLSQIVEHSMDDMRYRLRQAIYAVALKKTAPSALSDDPGTRSTSSLSEYEDWMLDQFIAQLTQNRNESSPIRRDDDLRRIHDDAEAATVTRPGHQMTISLETFTPHPISTYGNKKLLTSEDFRLMDSPETAEASSSLAVRFDLLPFWLLILVAFSVIMLTVVIILLVLAVRKHRKHRKACIRRMPFPDPVTISGLGCVPDYTNTPGNFLARIRQLENSSTVRDRDAESLWAHPVTTTTSVQSLREI